MNDHPDLDLAPDLASHVDTLTETAQRYRVHPGAVPDLAAIDSRGTSTWDGDKAQGKEALRALGGRLGALQEKLYAEGRHRLLVVLQATDTGGKDSTIKHVFSEVNPQGVTVASFKRPTEHELARDFLWRVHARVPADGQITIFNRSHYEDVLVVRVHEMVPQERWRRRYEHIRSFEQMLVDEGTTIVKFFLHISRDEQRQRLQDRLDQPDKHWKFEKGDLAERARWPDYQAAFTEAITETSTQSAPWYIVPADRKWYRNLVISQILIDTLEGLDMKWPDAEEDLEDLVIPR
ncbi:MAG TPA: polyphosphate kinase 2 family protein [Euzebya sp.]|nr:polyphosphate kinase 2 family protein [Euzebya sp.]